MFFKHKYISTLVAIGIVTGLASMPTMASAATFHYKYTTYKVLPSGGTHIWKYSCGSGQKIVSGGFDSIFNSTYGKGLRLIESYPSKSNQWRWTFVNKGPKSAQYRLAYICAG